MRYAYAHFPIQGFVADGGKAVEIRNILAEKIVKKIPALECVKISINENEKVK